MYATNTSPATSALDRPLRFSAVDAVGTRTFALLSCAYYVVGTMGLLTPASIEQRSATSNWGLSYEHENRYTPIADVDTSIEPTPAENIARIRAVLKPAVLELANLFGVSRQSIYDWQRGSQPSSQVADKLAALARAADVFEASGVTVNTQTLRRRVSGGSTLLDTVLNGGDAVRVAQSFVQTLKREATQQQQLSQRLAGRKAPPIETDDYVPPQLSDVA